MSDHAVILLAEDQEDDIYLIRKAFERAGVVNPLHVVRDGEEAVCYLSGAGPYTNRDEHPLPELILLDLKMPKVSGFEVLQWMRKQDGLKGIAVVVLTSSEQVWEINKAYAFGANSFLVKPADFHDFTTLAGTIQKYWMKTVKMAESSRPERPQQTNSEKGPPY